MTTSPRKKAPSRAPSTESPLKTRYGHPSEDGREWVITDPRTPSPWTNILTSEGGYSAIVSSVGGGFSWLGHPSANRVTRWNQDHLRDEQGRFVYLREEGQPPISLTWQPTRRNAEHYRCVHGLGYSRFEMRDDAAGWETAFTVFVPPGETLEVWDVKVRNLTRRARKVELVSYLEWCLGTGPDTMREFEKCFFELEHQDGVLLASKRLWKIPSPKGHYNERWPSTAFHGCSLPASRVAVEREQFLGRYGTFEAPAFGLTDSLPPTPGATDAIAALGVPLPVPGGGEARVVFTVGAAPSRARALAAARRYRDPKQADRALGRVRRFWEDHTAALKVQTPEPAVDLLANTWLPYQVLASREWGKTSYYWHGGATGAREIQDALAIVVQRPELARERLVDNLVHIARDGTVPHHWDPLTGERGRSVWSDDMLWTAFVLVEYVKETGDLSLLSEELPWLDGGAASGLEHLQAALSRVLSRRGRSGLPLILEGDWNDGLSAVGKRGRGESVWLGMFLHGILLELAELISRSRGDLARTWRRQAAALRRRIDQVAWDGGWYRRARTDDGAWLGSRGNKEGRIYLNSQVWAITMGVAGPERQPALLAALDQHLYGQEGPVLFAPPYTRIDESIGYLTRYNPGVRENGGVYTHAVNWAIWAECMAGRPDRAWAAFRAIAPPLRALEPERYRAEPYVTAGNIEGPPSPYAGRGGWTWFSSSGAWLFKMLTERLLGIRPALDGLCVDPVLPADWPGFTARRRFRGATYDLEVVRDPRATGASLRVDGEPVRGNVVPPHGDGRRHEVVFTLPAR